MKYKKFREKVYNTRLTLIWDCKAFEAEEYLKRSEISKRTDLVKCSGQTGRYSIAKGNEYVQTRYYIWIEKGTDRGTLIHEIAHLIFMSLSDCGIWVDKNTDEIYAYYLEWWYKQLYPVVYKNL